MIPGETLPAPGEIILNKDGSVLVLESGELW